MQPHRFLRAVVSMALLITTLAGCAAAVPTPDPVTITFVHPNDQTGSYETWALEFQEQYPHITVELESRNNLNQADLAKRDVFTVSNFDWPGLLESQSVRDLSGFIELDDELDVGDFYPSSLDAFRGGGRQWGLPFGIDVMMIHYNRDLFDRYGVPYREAGWDWGDFVDTALGVTDPAAEVYGYGVQHESEYAIFEPVIFIYQRGGGIFDSLTTPTMPTLDDPLNIEAMEFYASLMYDHGVAPTPEDAQRMGRPYPWRSVMMEKVAMWTTFYSQRGGLQWRDGFEFNWGVAPMPRDATAGTLAQAEGLFISAASEHPDAAWKLVSFLSTKMAPFQIPARQSLAESSAFEQSVGADVALAARATLADAILVHPAIMGFETALGAMGEAFTKIRMGQVPADIALSEAQQKAGP